MAVKQDYVLFCYFVYMFLASVSVVSGFTPVTYPARVSSECGQYDIPNEEQTTEALKPIHHCIDSKKRSC